VGLWGCVCVCVCVCGCVCVCVGVSMCLCESRNYPAENPNIKLCATGGASI